MHNATLGLIGGVMMRAFTNACLRQQFELLHVRM
jgi:hypothetical protein